MDMKNSFSRKKIDLVDLLSGVTMALAAAFVTTFFWQAAAGASGSEESFMARLRMESAKRIEKEQAQIRFLLDMEDEGKTGDALSEGAAAAERFDGNSQFHLLLARGYREQGDLGTSVVEYRRALESNRDYSDRRSTFYLGSTLRPFIREVRLARAEAGPGSAGNTVVRRDLFYLERSLAGGCH
jgi:hypothetical protein